MSPAVKCIALGVAICAGLGSVAALAEPVEFDTPDAHVIVVRPVDVWSRDAARADDTLDVVRNKKANYAVFDQPGKDLNGGPIFIYGVSDAPIISAANARLQAAGFEIARTQDYRFFVNRPVHLVPAEYADFRQQEEELLRRAVFYQGDPRTLRARVSRGKFVGGIASVAVYGLVAQVGGMVLANASMHAGFIGDVYQANQSGIHVTSPARLPEFDASGFSEIEVRRVGFSADMIGQIVIAYRAPKTEDAQREALVRAIVSLAGADTTPAAIEQARAQDYAWRLEQWDACVEASNCAAEKP